VILDWKVEGSLVVRGKYMENKREGGDMEMMID
jgi:hypothetical protein